MFDESANMRLSLIRTRLSLIRKTSEKLRIGRVCRVAVDGAEAVPVTHDAHFGRNGNTKGVSATAITIISRSSGIPIRR